MKVTAAVGANMGDESAGACEEGCVWIGGLWRKEFNPLGRR